MNLVARLPIDIKASWPNCQLVHDGYHQFAMSVLIVLQLPVNINSVILNFME